MGLKGVLWVCIMGSRNVIGLDYGSNISELRFQSVMCCYY